MTFHSKLWRELLEAPKDVGITTLVVEILFGLSGGCAYFSQHMTRRFPPPWSVEDL
jgi:hypothetical protein